MASDRVLERVYYDPASAGFMAGVSAVFREARKRRPTITLTQTRDWLDRQRVYTLHRPQRHRFRRNRTTGVGLSTHIMMDTADMSRLKYHNSHYAHILFTIDVFSRQAHARALKTKRPRDVLPALRECLEQYPNTCWTLEADFGTEFLSDVRRWITHVGMTFVQLSNSPHKASICERLILSAKLRLNRYMTLKGTKRWVDALQPIMRAYNNSYHRSIGRTPNSITPANEEQVYRELHSDDTGHVRYKYAIGDRVRIKIRKSILAKGYTPTFTVEHYIVHERLTGRRPATYRIRTALGDEPISGVFYESELCPAGEETGPRERHG